MNVNSNSYTYTFALILVIVVAALLAGAASVLKPFQQANIELEKKQNILKSIGVVVERNEAEAPFDKMITEYVIKGGSIVEAPEVAAFDIDMAKAIKVVPADREVPLYIAVKEGEKFYILPLRGKGLWGPIWGYIALEADGQTIAGATFDHKGETPGLGAEIATDVFQDQFLGKSIFENGNYAPIMVMKGTASGDHQVDGISGGTITSVGLEAMLDDCIQPYKNYLKTVQ